ncbi:MAG: hypothetical protein HPY80_13275, partial [Bacteroidales bacterium]|nr:hypothetical protein [Bacteroidales bacterium]
MTSTPRQLRRRGRLEGFRWRNSHARRRSGTRNTCCGLNAGLHQDLSFAHNHPSNKKIDQFFLFSPAQVVKPPGYLAGKLP